MRVVLDTNTVLSAILFPSGRLTWVRDLWCVRRIVPLICRDTARELIQAMAYPKFRLDEDEIQTLLSAYLPFTETVDPQDAPVDVPRCRDPDDQKFLRLASVGRADVVVTGDRDLLDLAGSVTFAIETAAAFKKRFA